MQQNSSLAACKPTTTPCASTITNQRSVEMEGKNFIKLCKDCKLMGKALTTTDIDLIFTKVKTKGARKIPYDQFVKAVDAIAAKKGCSYEEVVAAVIAAGAPVDGGTKAEAVRLHDDKVRGVRLIRLRAPCYLAGHARVEKSATN
jgi:hypothetical protein